MGAFNEWVKGSYLEAPRNRRVVTVAGNLLYGAAVLLRLQILRCQGVSVPPEWSRVEPLEPRQLDALLDVTAPAPSPARAPRMVPQG
jgi:hypothetical protein